MKLPPIGIFDSGIGGLTVAKSITEQLPYVDLIYFGDTAHFPYGNKSSDAIRYYCLEITNFLIKKGCKIVVIACNSASAAAYSVLKNFFAKEGITIINVVDPLVQFVAQKGYNKIGVIATKVTIQSKIYEQKLKELGATSVSSLATPLLAPMIEEGYIKNAISKTVLNTYLEDNNLDSIDTLLLACTHYPLIKSEITDFWNGSVDIWDSTDVVVEEIKKVLPVNVNVHTTQNGNTTFYVSDLSLAFEDTTKIFYGTTIHLKKATIW